ncbi:protein prenylyltransferase [Auriculariales sp. MPI-PUGE-AT-0066]|nr:protein prenylyltransferase [Auriculariales sp. MPI-PUGE-AT-0066]
MSTLIPPDPSVSTLYADNPIWADLKPVEQDVGENPMAPIFYAAEYKDATDYFRGVVAVGEHSARVLELTERIIRLNPAHYTVWQYRWRTLQALKSDLATETTLMDELGATFLKNYQVWHHRRLLVSATQNAEPELVFSANVVKHDAKNYHTWAYRQWVLAHFNRPSLWKGELEFVDTMLGLDVRNNSAWHHRFFVVWLNGVVGEDETDREDVLRRELAYAKEKIALAPNNESAWNYLRGVLQQTQTPFSTLRNFVEPYAVARTRTDGASHYVSNAASAAAAAEEEEEVIDLESPLPSVGATLPCRLAIEFLAEIHEREGSEGLAQALKMYTALATEHDTIRKKYWEHRAREAEKLHRSKT